jgi:hypothetical protein
VHGAKRRDPVERDLDLVAQLRLEPRDLDAPIEEVTLLEEIRLVGHDPLQLELDGHRAEASEPPHTSAFIAGFKTCGGCPSSLALRPYGRMTDTGVARSVVVPSPSWPLAFCPQHLGADSTMAQACHLPAPIPLAPLAPMTDTGTRVLGRAPQQKVSPGAVLAQVESQRSASSAT